MLISTELQLNSSWIQKECKTCGNSFPTHVSWKIIPEYCEPCKLIKFDFVEAIRVILVNPNIETSKTIKDDLQKLLKIAEEEYQTEIHEHLDDDDLRNIKQIAWRKIERKLAEVISHRKETKRHILAICKNIRQQEQENQNAVERNQNRDFRITAGMRRIS